MPTFVFTQYEELEAPLTPLNIILFGAPASGKGTNAAMLVERYGLVHISTGDLFRFHIATGTELGRRAHSYVESGQLVPDELVVALVLDRIQQEDAMTQGWLLDGFPRSATQAMQFIDAGFYPSHAFYLAVPDDVVVDRMAGRLTDPETGHSYHRIYRPPPDDPELQARLIIRKDDTAEAIRERLSAFHAHNDECMGCFESVLHRVDATRGIEDVAEEIAEILRKEE